MRVDVGFRKLKVAERKNKLRINNWQAGHDEHTLGNKRDDLSSGQVTCTLPAAIKTV